MPGREAGVAGEMVAEPAEFRRRSTYGELLLRARRRFLVSEAVTAAAVRRVYQRTAAGVAADLRREALRAGDQTLRARHLAGIQVALQNRMRGLNEDVLEALRHGIDLSVATGLEPFEVITARRWGPVLGRTGIRAVYADVNQRATVALLARTLPDGLQLSERVWRSGRRAQGAVTKLVEEAVARGRRASETAREVERYLLPGQWTALKEETRRRLGVPKDVSMEATRLAVTETNNAFREAQALGAQTSGADGVYWRLSGVHAVRDVCDELATRGGDGFWGVDEIPASPHPWCRCTTIPAWKESEEAFLRRLNRWVNEPGSEPELEGWFQEHERFLERPAPVGRTGGEPPQQDRGADPEGAAQALAGLARRIERVERSQWREARIPVGVMPESLAGALRLDRRPRSVVFTGQGLEHVRRRHPEALVHAALLPQLINSPTFALRDRAEPGRSNVALRLSDDHFLFGVIDHSGGDSAELWTFYVMRRRNVEKLRRQGVDWEQ